MNEIIIAYNRFAWEGSISDESFEQLMLLRDKYERLNHEEEKMKDDFNHRKKRVRWLQPLVDRFAKVKSSLSIIADHLLVRSSYVYFMFMKNDAQKLVDIFRKEKKPIKYYCLLPYAPPSVQGVVFKPEQKFL